MTKEERLQRDIDRLAAMRAHEDELRQHGYEYIAGIDEVGRGPLAGPVYAACVVLPPDFNVLGIYDSKKLSVKKREELAEIIKERAVAYGIGIADNNEIDEINILEATKLAMKRAIDCCNSMLSGKQNNLPERSNSRMQNSAPKDAAVSIDMLLVDALKLDTGIPCEAIIKGDEKSLSIAAASIVAKVARDTYMIELDEKYPGYDLASNKGYGTAAHYKGLREKGISDIHRRSFLRKFEEDQNEMPISSAMMAKDQGVTQSANSPQEMEKRKDSIMGKKVYAVKKGRTTGIFMNWEDCKAQVDGFAGAEYKSFADPTEAMTYLGLDTDNAAKTGEFPEGVRAYVDGSYDNDTGRFSCGVVIIETDAAGNSEVTELKSVFDDAVAAEQRNVAGEIMGAKTAIDYCMEHGIHEVEVYHDYEGVGKWADDQWKANNPLTKAYKQYVADARERMNVKFVKVKAHAGNKYNELADKLAKAALDL